MNLKRLLKQAGATFLIMGCVATNAEHADAANADNGLIGFISATKEGNGDGDIVLSSDQEIAARNFFESYYVNSGNGELLSSHNLGGLNVNEYKCIWIHIDRKDTRIGWRNLPEEFTTPEFIRAIHDYMIQGGNIYLTGQSTQLVVPIWRVNSRYTINQYDAGGELVQSPDVWSIRTDYRTYDGNIHPIFNGLNTINGQEGIYGLLGGNDLLRENHNTIWNLFNLNYKYGSEGEEGYGETLSNIRKFEIDNQATILSTFDWDNKEEFAGIVEFHPIFSWNAAEGKYNKKSGTVICNGHGAMQWNCNVPNECFENMSKLTKNIIDYLCGNPTVKEGPPYCLPSSDDSVEIIESTGLIAMYLDYPNTSVGFQALERNGQEYAAYKYFVENFANNEKFNNLYGSRRPTVLWKDDLDKIKFCGQENDGPTAEGYECIWVNIDREGLFGDQDISGNEDGNAYTPTSKDLKKIFAGENYDRLAEALRAFRKDGGNLYLTKWANLMLPDLDPAIMSPTQVTSKEKTEKDGWGMNVNHHGYDKSNHPIFQNLNLQNEQHGTVFYLFQGDGTRRDTNCLWWLDDAHCKTENTWTGNPDERLNKFNEQHNATVLGVWGHADEYAYYTAGLVEFHPVRAAVENGPMRVTPRPTVHERRGTAMANGFGTYEWETSESTTNSDENVKKLTSNILAYLTPVMTEPTYTGIEDIVEDKEMEAKPIYFNLQGVRIYRPESGIFIEVRGSESRKVVF